jgi:hypothetical protein
MNSLRRQWGRIFDVCRKLFRLCTIGAADTVKPLMSQEKALRSVVGTDRLNGSRV